MSEATLVKCVHCSLFNAPSRFLCQACFSRTANSDDILAQAKEKVTKEGQAHLLAFASELSDAELNSLLLEISRIDFGVIARVRALSSEKEEKKMVVEPFPLSSQFEMDESLLEVGLAAIRDGKCAVCILGGGQGTRLGCVKPKGVVDVGLVSGKSLYQIHCERLIKATQLAGASSPSVLPLYVMTSRDTHEETLRFFESKGYFGLKAEDVVLFTQDEYPCLDLNFSIVMKSKHAMALSPNGNGGVYSSLKSSGVLNDLARVRGVDYLQVFGVDNLLAKIADPYWYGHCVKRRLDVSNKVCRKNDPDERVGVMCLRNGKASVIEYSEISKEMAHARYDGDGHLIYSASNLAMHAFSVKFLSQCCEESKWQEMPIHQARKVIKGMDRKTGQLVELKGIKMEHFIFDTFEWVSSVDSISAYRVKRQEEFSPIKNKIGKSSPATAKRDLSEFWKEKLIQSGAQIEDDDGESYFEVSPLVSYFGEGLKERLAGMQKIKGPLYLK